MLACFVQNVALQQFLKRQPSGWIIFRMIAGGFAHPSGPPLHCVAINESNDFGAEHGGTRSDQECDRCSCNFLSATL
jgi:hypothetical protein